MKQYYTAGLILTIAVTLIFSSCATILGGKKNQLIVEDGQPPTAEV